jgi:DnaJ-class molecular chaperone
MIINIECRFCNGLGRVHSAGHNGDPMDMGEDCPVCLGAGVVDEDLNEEADDE